jgi:hypothetical protein
MLTFIVPIKSKKIASDWSKVSKLAERTLKSICNQNNNSFRVLVVCHEFPDINYKNDKIEYIQVQFDPPTLIDNMSSTDVFYSENTNLKLVEKDKCNKLLAAYERVNPTETDYIMVVDADDCISNDIVSFVEKEKSKQGTGWYIYKGYYYREGTNYMIVNRKSFNGMCGSSIIIRNDLFKQLLTNDPFFNYEHQKIKLSNGNMLMPLPLKGAMYSMGNGENVWMSPQYFTELKTKKNKFFKIQSSFLTTIWNRLNKYHVIPITRGFKNKFNFYNV